MSSVHEFAPRAIAPDRLPAPAYPGALERIAAQMLTPSTANRAVKRHAPVYELSKRLIDCALASLLIWIAAPTILICAILIKLDSPGPVFFFQDRTGKGGRRFRLCKLRTMVVDADELKEKLQKFNKLSYPDFKMENDPRITRVGNFLRKTSLDELPNLFNIFAGNMSFVGPRPTSFAAETYKTWQTARLSVLPGITGLW